MRTKCTCGMVVKVSQKRTDDKNLAGVEFTLNGIEHRWDGPCYLSEAPRNDDELAAQNDFDVGPLGDKIGRLLEIGPATEIQGPDGGSLLGYAGRQHRFGPEGWQQERKLREAVLGEQQPEPTPTDEPSAHDLVIADMAARKEFGLAKYGTLLQASNGRDNLQDLYEELLDACVYIRNEIERRKLFDEFPVRTIEGS